MSACFEDIDIKSLNELTPKELVACFKEWGIKYIESWDCTSQLECKWNNDNKWSDFSERNNYQMYQWTISQLEERIITKISNNHLKRKEIDPNSEWMQILQTYNAQASSDDYLKFDRFGKGKKEKFKILKYNKLNSKDKNFLSNGYKKSSDPNKALIESINHKYQRFKKMSDEKGECDPDVEMARVKMVVDILNAHEQFGANKGEQMTLVNENEDQGVADNDNNPINLGDICAKYGFGGMVRSTFFPDKEGKYHKGITGKQTIIGSPFYATNLHKEHGKCFDFINHLFEGTKLWLWIRGIDDKDIENEFAEIVHGIECSRNVWYHQQCWFIKWVEFVRKYKHVEGYYTFQNPGESVIGKGNIYHQVIHMNKTVCEAIDVADDNWLNWSRFYCNGIADQIEYSKKHQGTCVVYGDSCILNKDFKGDEFSQDFIDEGLLIKVVEYINNEVGLKEMKRKQLEYALNHSQDMERPQIILMPDLVTSMDIEYNDSEWEKRSSEATREENIEQDEIDIMQIDDEQEKSEKGPDDEWDEDEEFVV